MTAVTRQGIAERADAEPMPEVESWFQALIEHRIKHREMLRDNITTYTFKNGQLRATEYAHAFEQWCFDRKIPCWHVAEGTVVVAGSYRRLRTYLNTL